MKELLYISLSTFLVYLACKEIEDEVPLQAFKVNFVIQLLLFVFVACIPCYKTNMMKNVDIAWPYGLIVMGVISLYYGTTTFPRKLLISLCYIIQGARMGSGAPMILKMKQDFPRYSFVEYVLDKKQILDPKKRMFYKLSDIMMQGIANMGPLNIPLLIISFNKDDSIYYSEIACFILYFVAIGLETLADMQKLNFIITGKRQGKDAQSAEEKEKIRYRVCNVGLWKYSRHPNYFFEFLIWVIYGIWSCINIQTLYSTQMIHTCIMLTFLFELLCMIWMFYSTLVYKTGAKPSEYFSRQKRPQYKQYQLTTNMFFPWFPKQIDEKATNLEKTA